MANDDDDVVEVPVDRDKACFLRSPEVPKYGPAGPSAMDWFKTLLHCPGYDMKEESTMPLKCTYCGGTNFKEGPSGGMSTNVLCANPECRHWFNWTEAIGQLDDLNRVEPTPEEKAEAERQAGITVVSQKEARYAEGAAAYREGKSVETLRTARASYEEPVWNMDRISGFLDAMAADIHQLRASKPITVKELRTALRSPE